MASQPIYEFYAELKEYEPKIWRHFQVSRNITMARLGYIIMTMFEMQASHLFCIEVLEKQNMRNSFINFFSEEKVEKMLSEYAKKELRCYEVQNERTEDFDDAESENAGTVKMYSMISKAGDEMLFSYDYGDGWQVKIVLERISKDQELPGKQLPCVIEGEGYGIIEDCGGVDGLKELSEVFRVRDKANKRYQELCEWLDMEELDLTVFDIEDMNFRLKKVPRIYKDSYELGYYPTQQSLDLLTRKYKKQAPRS